MRLLLEAHTVTVCETQLAAVAIDGVTAVRIAWRPSPEALCRYTLRRAFLCKSTARYAHENN